MSVIRKGAVLLATVALGIGISATSTAVEPAQATQLNTVSQTNPTTTQSAEQNAAVGGAYGCSGTLVEQDSMVSQWGTLYGYLDLYIDGSYACAVTIHAPGYQGTALTTKAEIDNGTTVVDSGNYTSYAGPVTMNVLGTCYSAVGQISGLVATTSRYCSA